MKIALVTGASGGLGREFVCRIEKKEKDIEEIWIIARRLERLEEVKENCKIKVRPISKDLTKERNIQEIEALLERENPEVKILVNAAGFGQIGSCKEIPRTLIDNMIALNCKATIDLGFRSPPRDPCALFTELRLNSYHRKQ